MVAFLARRYAEPVEVQRGDDAPARFVWRGRHYTVREVLAHWTTTGPWWEQAAVTRVLTGEPATGDVPAPDLVAIPPAPRWGQRAWGEPAPDVGAVATVGEVDDDEREFWRVEASVGRAGRRVVVELCFAWSTAVWTLTAVMD